MISLLFFNVAVLLCRFYFNRIFNPRRYGTFLRRWNEKWTLILKFRDKNSFSQCDVCQELKWQPLRLVIYALFLFCLDFIAFFCVDVFDYRHYEFINIHIDKYVFNFASINRVILDLRFQDKSLHMDIRLGALKLYRQHLVSQYADRCSFWCLKDISSEQMSRTITISTDGADQARLLHFGIFPLSARCPMRFPLLSCPFPRPNTRYHETLNCGHHTGQANSRDPNLRSTELGVLGTLYSWQS